MSIAVKPTRAQLWMESLGEWSWPGQSGAAAAEVLPPSWVPAFPPRRDAAIALPGVTARQARARRRALMLVLLLSAIVSVTAALALRGELGIGRLLGTAHAAPAATQALPASFSSPSPLMSLPSLTQVSQDAAGSSIDTASYTSKALHGAQGSFLVYLPANYVSTTAHYPVLYMLTGTDQPSSAFLEIGLQNSLDELIAAHTIPPMIAVMIQGGPGSNLWRNQGATRYESYILEVQQMVDQMLPTIPARDARAVVGDSMGAYGAMNVALSNPYRFAVVESWLGFFNGLESDLHADAPIFSRLGLHAFVYGGESDHIANPAEDAPFAAALRQAGADAHSAIYPGEHNLATLEAHLTSMLTYAGRALVIAQHRRPAVRSVARARTRVKAHTTR
jgi:enterochelin esterase-like enzyme